MQDIIRRVRLSPYRKGSGPTFTLTIGDPLNTTGRDRLTYTLESHENGKTRLLFSGTDFGPSPLHAWDSDNTAAALLSFLTLRPGDTDAEYFDAYTPAQMTFAETHAETLGYYCFTRFGED